MTDQSNSAAERSAHVHRGDAPLPADWPVVRMPDGTWKLKSVVALENRIETLEAALRVYECSGKCANCYGAVRNTKYCGQIARAALKGGKDE